MKRFLVASLGVAVLAWGADAVAAPKMLSEVQLDKVVAGSFEEGNNVDGHHVEASGGAIIGADSEASFNTEGHVNLSGSAQKDASAVNMVNAAESLVGNGVNIWTDAGDTIKADGNDAALAYVEQSNEINQDARKVAHVGHWEHKNVGLELSGSSSSELTTSVETSGWALGAAGTLNLENSFSLNTEGSICLSGDGGTCKANYSDKSSEEGSLKLDFTHSKLEHASAEYITGDNVKLDVNSINTVCLSDNAQQNASAVNIVNAASSLVANGVNVATTGLIDAYSVNSYATAYLTQSNNINQRR